MKYTYEEVIDVMDNASIVRYLNGEINCFIPKDEGNSDYQRYLRWLENPDAEENGTIS
jgi:hypothetical protein